MSWRRIATRTTTDHVVDTILQLHNSRAVVYVKMTQQSQHIRIGRGAPFSVCSVQSWEDDWLLRLELRLLYGWTLMWVTYWPRWRLANLLPRPGGGSGRDEREEWCGGGFWWQTAVTRTPPTMAPCTRVFHRSWPNDSQRAGSSSDANLHTHTHTPGP